MDSPAMPPTPEPLPPPRPVAPQQPPAKPTMTAAPDDAFHAPRPVTTCRFLDDPGPPKPAGDGEVIMAVIRRVGSPGVGVSGLRKTVETACRAKAVECQTEVADERQVRVMLTVRSKADWEHLYTRLQDLADMGEFGLLFQVRVEKDAK
jgi:hypothetical protein